MKPVCFHFRKYVFGVGQASLPAGSAASYMFSGGKGTVKGLESRLQAAECARFWAGEEDPGYRYAASCRQWSTPGRDARRTGANMAALHLRSKRKEHTLESWLVHELTYVQV